MESEKQTTEKETVPQHLTSYKLLIDPALTKGLYRVYRFDGIRFNIPVSIFIFLWQIIGVLHTFDHGNVVVFCQQLADLPAGLEPLDRVKDPRVCRLWSSINKVRLLPAKYKVRHKVYKRINVTVVMTYRSNLFLYFCFR